MQGAKNEGGRGRVTRRTMFSGLAGLGLTVVGGKAALASDGNNGQGKGAKKPKTPKLTVLADGLDFPEGPTVLPNGDVLVVEVLAKTLTRIKPNGKKETVANLGGGPNGSALGPDGRVYVANCGGLGRIQAGPYVIAGGTPADYVSGSIQAVNLTTGAVQVLYTKDDNGRTLRGPDDLVFDARGGFYFTDYGKTQADKSDVGYVYYAKADGSSCKPVASGLQGPNGIGLSPDGGRLYVTETYTARIWWWDVTGPGVIVGGKSLAGSGNGNFLYSSSEYQNFDSLGVDAHGNINVACLVTGAITVVSPDGELIEVVDAAIDGDPGITNIKWGGKDMRTAYITASSTGRLLKVDWPRPGLKLNFSE